MATAGQSLKYTHSPARLYIIGVQGIYLLPILCKMEEVPFSLSEK